MRYRTDSTIDEKKIRFGTLRNGDVFRLGSTLYVKTEELEIRDDDDYSSDKWKYFNAIDLKYGEHKYFEDDDTIEYYNGEIIFREDEFQTTWN